MSTETPYIIAREDTGEILRTGMCPVDMLDAQAGPGEVAFPGVASDITDRAELDVDEGWVTCPRPDAPIRQAAHQPPREAVATLLAAAGGVENLPAAWCDALRVHLLARLAERRWEVETRGIEWDGHLVQTDRLSRATLADYHASGWSGGWKCADGTWLTLDVAGVAALHVAIRAHVAACFSTEADLSAAVASASTDRATLVTLASAIELFTPSA